MKKILRFALLLCLCIVSFVSFTACNMLSLNTEKDYNQVVVVAGDMKFTKRDLINDYYSYGYQYYQGTGDIKSALQQTARAMVQRNIVYEEIKKVIDLTNYKGENLTNDIVYDVYQSMQEAFEKIEAEVRKEWYNETVTESEEESTLRAEKNEYKPKVELNENNELVRVLQPREHKNLEQMPAKFETYNASLVSNKDEKLIAEVWTRYIKTLQISAKNESRPLDKESVLAYEQERLTKQFTNNKYIELYEEYIFENVQINIQDIVDYFKRQYTAQHTLFSGATDTSMYDDAMAQATGEYVYYHDTKSKGYINVSHILIKFGDTASKKIANLKTTYGITSEEQESKELNNTDSDYYKDYVKLLGEIEVTFQQGDDIKTNSLINVQNEILSNVGNIAKSEMKDRFKEFERLMYLYNDDDGAMNADFYYNVNLDTSVQDRMLARFANASRELANDSKYGLGDIYTGGPFNGLVITEYESGQYGAHIIIHGGLAENFIDINSIGSLTFDMLYERTVNPASDKTLFHYFYDLLIVEEFDKVALNIVNTKLAEIGTIEYHERYYKDLWS